MKVDSNEHGAMEQNEDHLEANISIYYTHETELYAESSDAMNMGMYCKTLRLGEEKSQPRELTRSGSGRGVGASSPELVLAVREEG